MKWNSDIKKIRHRNNVVYANIWLDTAIDAQAHTTSYLDVCGIFILSLNVLRIMHCCRHHRINLHYYSS